MRRTRALALATVYEALVQAQNDHVMQHEQETMQFIVRRLEVLEARIMTLFVDCPQQHGEAEELALLQHLGKGVALVERVSRISQRGY
jgi:hypothetical protein